MGIRKEKKCKVYIDKIPIVQGNEKDNIDVRNWKN